MDSIIHHLRRLYFAVAGIWYALRCDYSFRWRVLLGSSAVVAIGFWAWPLTEVEIVLLALAYLLVLITELQNSALEEALDHLHPEVHDRIGYSKDMAAGSVLLAGCFAALVAVVVLFF